MLKPLRLTIFLLLISIVTGCTNFSFHKKDFLLMDTFVRIDIRDAINAKDRSRFEERAIERMKKLEARFDYFSKDSEVSAINRIGAKQRFLLSSEMYHVLKKAKDVELLTGGAFDITLGKKDWRLDTRRKTIYLMDRNTHINLGGIAKGFIVDEGIKTLIALGVKNALINAGGDMYCLGEGPRSSGWKVGIRDPRELDNVKEILIISDKGVATSGGYERANHIFNPMAGEYSKEAVKSVTVIAPDCISADALATAFYVMDPEEAISIVHGIKGVECVIIDETGFLYTSAGVPKLT